MLLIVGLATLVLIGLRLAGNVSIAYQAIAHLFLGGLLGYAVATYEWFVIICSVLLCVTEGYMVLTRFIPSLAIANLIHSTTAKPTK